MNFTNEKRLELIGALTTLSLNYPLPSQVLDNLQAISFLTKMPDTFLEANLDKYEEALDLLKKQAEAK